jgi:hypothetical protein
MQDERLAGIDGQIGGIQQRRRGRPDAERPATEIESVDASIAHVQPAIAFMERVQREHSRTVPGFVAAGVGTHAHGNVFYE